MSHAIEGVPAMIMNVTSLTATRAVLYFAYRRVGRVDCVGVRIANLVQ